VTNEHRSQVGKIYGDVRDTFKLGVKQAPHARNTIHGSATVTAVEWSPAQIRSSKGDGEETKTQYSDSLVAAAGSSGVICIWNAKQTFFSEGSGESSTLQNQQPEAILGQQHTRAVNSLAWHPKRPGILLSASQVRTRRLMDGLANSWQGAHVPTVMLVRTQLSNCGNGKKSLLRREMNMIRERNLDSLI
jgi:WD40 repeat protein